MFTDSGANSNIIDEGTWEQLKVKGVKCESQAPSPDKKLYPYASRQPLPVQGSFKCTVSVCDRSTKAEVLVIKGRGMSLLGKITATELGVLKVGINIAMVTSKADSLKQQYPRETLLNMPWVSAGGTARSPEPIRSTSLHDGPWQDLAVDLMGPLPSGHSLLVIVDYYSRFYEVEVMQSTTTDKIIDRLAHTFCRHGLPNTIKSDNGSQFKSNEE